MDLGGADVALDLSILPFIDYLSPNEHEIDKIISMNLKACDDKSKLCSQFNCSEQQLDQVAK